MSSGLFTRVCRSDSLLLNWPGISISKTSLEQRVSTRIAMFAHLWWLFRARQRWRQTDPFRCEFAFGFPATMAMQWPTTSKDFHPRFYPLLNSWERVFPFKMLSAKQGNYWYHFYKVFGMTWSLTGDWTRDLLHWMPALYH